MMIQATRLGRLMRRFDLADGDLPVPDLAWGADCDTQPSAYTVQLYMYCRTPVLKVCSTYVRKLARPTQPWILSRSAR